MDLDVLNRYYAEGWLIKQTHPTLPLTIWNYSQSTQFERKWDDITLQCRGLVTDDKGNVVARPFRKFFNIEEGKHTPTKDFKVYEKMDGSLIIVFTYEDQWVVASRGSFASDQAQQATEFSQKYPIKTLDTTKTYVFELIAKNNRIVVDYGDYQGLVLLGAIDTQSGEEVSFEQLKNLKGFDVVKQYDNVEDFSTLKETIHDNQEGFIIHFSNGDRCKIKGEEYLRLHEIMTNASTTAVWSVLKNQDSMESYLKEVPDEFYQKIRNYIDLLETEYWEIANKADAIFRSIYKSDMDAKAFSLEVKYLESTYQKLMWAQYHMKMNNYSDCIWEHIKPEFRKL